MQKVSESILRAVNSDGKINVLTFPVHERWQSNLGQLNNITFYMWQGKAIKKWNSKFAEMPKNHILLTGSEDQILNDMKFDVVLSQNKYGNYQEAIKFAHQMNLPLISLEHTDTMPFWTQKYIKAIATMRGDLNVFISEYSTKKWHFDVSDPTVRILRHGVDTDIFKPKEGGNSNGKILYIVNDSINRAHLCGHNILESVVIKNKVPFVALGDTPGFSKPAKDIEDLVSHYQDTSCFVNFSLVSPIPSVLLEAASCGCPIVSTNNCAIPEFFTNGVNAWLTNDEKELKQKIDWCLENPDKAKEMGRNARNMILEKASLDRHLKQFESIIMEVYGKGFNYDRR